ncbi:MAG: tyrosine-type recombinase/integrase [Phototrophicaceae bacterium]
MSDLITPESALGFLDTATFNFAAALPGRATSRHTERAYYRWIDTFLYDMASLPKTERQARRRKMEALPIKTLQVVLNAQHLRVWLGRLAREGQGKQALDQARASVVTLCDLMAEAGWLPDEVAGGMGRVSPPRAESGQRPGRWLSPRQLRELMDSAEAISETPTQGLRNSVALAILCTMALRREELTNARWGDLSIQNERMVLQVHGKGKKTAFIDVPQPVRKRILLWQRAVAATQRGYQQDSPLIRRMWKGGSISPFALTTDGLWYIVSESARQAGLGKVAPHDLRRSVAGALSENGVPIEKISQLLRHSNVAVTERYLSKLPQVNSGAVLMSNVLGFEEDDEEEGAWFGG